MNASTPRSKAVRSRAIRRLRNLTIGTTLAGVAASAGFGWLAAVTYDGTGSGAANPTASDSTTSDTTSSDSMIAAPATTDTGGSSTTSPPASSSGVARSSSRAHVSTGGS